MTSLPVTMATVRSEFFQAGGYTVKIDYAKKIFEFRSSGEALEFHD